MLVVEESVQAGLRTHQEGVTRALASYQNTQTPLQIEQDGSITFRGDAVVQAVTTITCFGVGNSLVPKAATDPLAPFGQEVTLRRDVRIGSQSWSVPLGVYRIQRAGASSENLRSGVVLDWSVTVGLADRFEQIQADDFLAVESPMPGNSVWSEIRRLSPIPVQVALGDAAVPPTTLYESRIGAITTLMSIIGGTPSLTRSGVLTARQTDAWLTATTPVFDIEGTIEWSDEITNDFVNQVQVTSSSDSSIVAYARIEDDSDPRSVRRAGGRTKRISMSTLTSVLDAQNAAATALLRLSTRRSRRVTVKCTPEALLLELGDVGWMRDPVQARAVFGEVASISMPLDPTATVQVDMIVAEAV